MAAAESMLTVGGLSRGRLQPPAASTSATASAKMRSAVSICSSLTMRAGTGGWRLRRPRGPAGPSGSRRSGWRRRFGRVEFDADHEAQAADVPDRCWVALLDGAQARRRLVATHGGVRDQLALQHADRLDEGGAGDRVAAVCRAVGTGAPGHDLVLRDHARDGHARGDALGGQQDVGLDAPVLDGPHLPGPPAPDWTSSATIRMPLPVADLAQAGQERVIGHDIAALALDGLHEDGRELVRPA